MAGIEIVEYKKRNLKELLADEKFWSQPQVPITKLRAISHAFNPRADDNDTVLITAVKTGRLLAYLGILPDLLVTEHDGRLKFGWLTTWWVDKTSDDRPTAAVLLLSALRRYSNRIAVSSPSLDAKRVYDATMRFQQCAKTRRSNFILALPPSIPALSRLSALIAGTLSRMIVGRSLHMRGLEIGAVDSLNEGLSAFINSWAFRDPLARDASYWRWVLEFPWLSAEPQDENTKKKYAFSAFAPDFKQIPVVVTRNSMIIAFLVMTLRDNRLCLKHAYYDFRDKSDIAIALRAFVADLKPWLFASADPNLNTCLRRCFPFYLAIRSKTSEIYATKELPLNGSISSQFGTGDIVFT
jgi:hypothetical protein